jgi:transposase-like protein
MSLSENKTGSQSAGVLQAAMPLHPALVEYACGDEPRRVIASRHGISPRTLTEWVRQAGLPRRKAGKPRLREPRALQKRILEQVGSAPMTEIAKWAGCSKQYVFHLTHRWSDWVPRRRSLGRKAALR